jgi:hypothetical protein
MLVSFFVRGECVRFMMVYLKEEENKVGMVIQACKSPSTWEDFKFKASQVYLVSRAAWAL